MNEQRRDALIAGTRLDGKYDIESVLGSGGFGIVYRVRHRHLDTVYAVKEYLPSEIALREGETLYPKSGSSRPDYQEGLNRFLKEAQQLVRFAGHPNIIRCRDYFEANGSAYLVMDFEDGMPLDKLLAGREAQGRPLSETELVGLLKPLLAGLSAVHAQDVLHRDIKPGNVFIRRRDEQPVLLDFGAAKQEFSRTSNSYTQAPYTPGYAAPEQVVADGHLGPWTDLYAVGALMWRIVTESVPPRVENRLFSKLQGRPNPLVVDEHMGDGRFRADLLDLMGSCLALDKDQRPQSAEAVLAALGGPGPALEAIPNPNPTPKPGLNPDPVPEPATPRNPVIWAAAGVTITSALLLGLGVWHLLSHLSPLPDNSGAVSPAGAETAKKRPAPGLPPGKTFRDALRGGGEGPEMVVLPTGRFRMGDLSGDGLDSEKPVRTVTITRPIAMGKYEVTFAQYDQFARAGGRELPDDEGWDRGTKPVINVSQQDARAYAQWLSTQTGKRYRLPTEAEWEYAARAGTTTKYSWGNRIAHEDANYGKDECCDGLASGRDRWVKTSPVGSFEANPFGLYDMHGNVLEWMEDCWHYDYKDAPSDGSARTSGCDRGSLAVVRGGSWFNTPQSLRSAYRTWLRPSNRYFLMGFRLVQDLNS